MPHEKLRPHFIFDEERLNELKKIAPEAFADGNINWETLKEALGDYLEEDGPDSEHFGLFWPGKRQARKLASIPSKGTLVPVPGEGVNEDSTHNVFIEAENLEALKLLQKSYAGKIKMIYIDPPYNTGNDFVYVDDFKEPLEEYLRRTGQLDEEGKPLTTNTKSDGRFHSKWLSMMYPRLRLARNLLRDDGLIIVSIDDNEVHNLRAVMNEIFGEENFMGMLTWLKKRKGSFLSKEIISVTEYCLIFKKSEDSGYLFGGKPDSSESQPIVKRTNGISTLKIPANSVTTKLETGIYKAGKYGVGTSAIKLLNDIKVKDSLVLSEFEIEGPFTWSQNYLNDQISKGAKLIINTNNFQLRAFKAYDENAFKGLPSIVNGIEISGTNEDAYEDLLQIFDNVKVFDYSKPSNFLKYLINAATYFDEDAIIMDFFAGSGTIGQAVFEYNIENNTNLNFVAVQMDQPIEDIELRKTGFNKISDVTVQRMKKVSSKLYEKNPKTDSDLGFKIYKLSLSNFKQWNNYEGQSIKELEKQFEIFSTPLIDDWKEENLLTEIILIEGFPLDCSIESQPRYKKNKVFQVSSDFCEHKLLICLDKKVEAETIGNLKMDDTDIFICLDEAITDQDKARLSDKGLLKTI